MAYQEHTTANPPSQSSHMRVKIAKKTGPLKDTFHATAIGRGFKFKHREGPTTRPFKSDSIHNAEKRAKVGTIVKPKTPGE